MVSKVSYNVAHDRPPTVPETTHKTAPENAEIHASHISHDVIRDNVEIDFEARSAMHPTVDLARIFSIDGRPARNQAELIEYVKGLIESRDNALDGITHTM